MINVTSAERERDCVQRSGVRPAARFLCAKSDWVDARLSARHARRARWNGEAGDSVRFANRADGFETPFQSEALSAGVSNGVARSVLPAYPRRVAGRVGG